MEGFDVHTFEDRTQGLRSRTNIVGEDAAMSTSGSWRLAGSTMTSAEVHHLRSFVHIRCTCVFRAPVAAEQRKKKASDRKCSSARAFARWKNL